MMERAAESRDQLQAADYPAQTEQMLYTWGRQGRVKVTLLAGRENGNEESLLEALLAGKVESDSVRKPFDGLAINKLL